jgi:hypothetical protein
LVLKQKGEIMKIKFILILLFFSTIAFAQVGTITGKVVDKTTREALPGVNIKIVGTDFGAATNIDGEFTIERIKVGTYSIQASFIGYDTEVKTDVIVTSAKPVQLNFELIPTVIQLQGVTVSSGYFRNIPTEVSSISMLNYEELRRSPGGFEDVVRALSVLPGVAQASAGRNDLVVRGGAPSENLFIVDGFVVPNINHFGSQGATGGPLSFINLDYVNEISFSTGGFSAVYGDKLSSVLTIDLKEGRKDRLGGKALVSATQFGLNFEGPVTSTSNFIFSVRRSYLDFIFNAAGFGFVPEYYDVLTKYSNDLTKTDKISFLFVGAFDRVKFNNDTRDKVIDNSRILASNQNQYVAGLSYRHLFGKGYYTVSLSRNFVDYDTFQKDTLFNPIFLNKSMEAENELKVEALHKIKGNAELNFGVSAKLIKFSADILFPDGFVTTFGDVLPVNQISEEKYFHKYAAFLQYSNVWFNLLRFNLGVRGDYFSEISKNLYFSPRLSISLPITEMSSINFSTGLYHQFPSYIWLVGDKSNKDLKAIKVEQFVLGYEHQIRNDIRIKLEGFYKNYKNYPTSVLRPYLVLANTGAGFAGSDDNFASFGLEPLVSEGKGYSRGAELSIQKKASDVPHYALASLTYSETYYTALNGIKYPGAYDQRWIFNLSAGYVFNEKYQMGVKFRLSTGSPYTPFESNGTQLLSNYNKNNFPLNHSMDIRVERRWNFETTSLITYIDVQNIYNRKNQTSIRWDYKENKVKEESSIGILPSIGVSLEF